EPAGGGNLLRAGQRRAGAARRAGCWPGRKAPDLPGRPRRVHRGVPGQWPGTGPGGADRRAGRAGPGRRHAHPGCPVDHHDGVFGRAARRRARGLGRARRGRRGGRGTAGAAAGVLAGGLLTTWLGWRAVFLVNVPVGAVAGLLSLRMVPRSAAASRAGRDLDLAGAALAVGGLVAATYAIAGAPSRGWVSA